MSAAITAAVIGLGAAGASAYSANKQAKDANKRISQQNAANTSLELAARGAPLYGYGLPPEVVGSENAFLPYYTGDAEARLGREAAAISKAIRDRGGSPEDQLAYYQELFGRYKDALGLTDQVVIDAATGRLVDAELADSEPVFRARTGVVEARRNSGLEALRETLNEIDSIQASKGYSGDSTGKRMLRFDARRKIGNDTAEGLALANLENEQERRLIKTTGRERMLTGGNAITNLMKQQAQREQLPSQALVNEFGQQLAPLEPFNIGVGAFSKPEPFVDEPDIIGSLASSIGGSLSKYYANRASQNAADGRASVL